MLKRTKAVEERLEVIAKAYVDQNDKQEKTEKAAAKNESKDGNDSGDEKKQADDA